MEEDMAGYTVQNHAFGGSADKDLVEYADRMLYAYDPKVVFFQTGSNDYTQATGTDEEIIAKCMDYKKEMFASFHEAMPDATFVIMSGLLLPGRSQYLDMTIEINKQLAELAEEEDYLIFVDANEMTYDGENFNTDIFEDDQIHLNHDGQMLWYENYIEPVLAELSENN